MDIIDVIRNVLNDSLWEIENIIKCSDVLGLECEFCGNPLWKHIYHTLHSLDQWFINPDDYKHPPFHEEGQNVLDSPSGSAISASTLIFYLYEIKTKHTDYLDSHGVDEASFVRVMRQFKHLHTHTGIIMACLRMGTDKWVTVKSQSRPLSLPDQNGIYFDS